jgi:hypothetical protein
MAGMEQLVDGLQLVGFLVVGVTILAALVAGAVCITVFLHLTDRKIVVVRGPKDLRGKRMGRLAGLLGASLWGLLLVGCAGWTLPEPGVGGFEAAGHATLARGSPAQPATSSNHVAVPFFPDDTDQCGPATLASVLSYWGVRTDPVALKEEIYLPRLKGTLPLDLLLTAQSRGLEAEIYEGSLDDLKSKLAAGRPLVALLDLGFAIFPQGHYVVVTGYDDQRQGVYAHSSLEKDVFIPYERFLRSWDRTGRWTLLLTLPESHLRSHV